MTLISSLNDKDEFTGFYLVKELDVKLTNATPPKDYWDLVLSDSSGQLTAKYWDLKPHEKDTLKPMMLAKVQGTVQLYRERLQMKVSRIRPAAPEDNLQLTDFIRAAPAAPDALMENIRSKVDSIQDVQIREITAYCVVKAGDRLEHYPAAKSHHHAYYAGLAYHMVRMLEIGEFLCLQRPFLNRDLLVAGIILHDLAKPEEMNAQLGIVSEYSDRGRLIGHLALISGWITEAALKLGIELESAKVTALQHLVLSHHNLGEWGSPVQPQMAEAVALHFIDSLDAKLQMVEDALGSTPEADSWTPMIRGLENKAIFKTSL
ncbi:MULTISPECIES: 3'-5' exoribonuclease YhaM family protein [Paenibacillus]|uniref:3'-5' exoribonuclease YhaM family protein n=1 Tax=Paenibacillus TaxID=44249 RepID=UPI00038F9E5D|nr:MULTISPECIES: HD domain-containing protein [Paenibacillus]KKC47228.1 phosphohydrolase [Paenibacillus sp. D9]CDN41144.1 3'-5' exoribonuclease YhaM [Paenibacillus sp. P22]